MRSMGHRSSAPRARLLGRLFALVSSCLLIAGTTGVVSANSTFSAKASEQPTIQYLNDTAGTDFTFTIHNTGDVKIGAVEIDRPWDAWKVVACPLAPVGWTTQRSDQKCRYLSAGSSADDIPGHSSNSAFKLTARTAAGSKDVSGSWLVIVSSTNSFSYPSKLRVATPEGPGLTTTAYSFQILDAVVVGAAPAPGSPCPASTPANHSAGTGATEQRIAICGKNRANLALTPVGAQASLGGTFIGSSGTFASGSVGANSASSVVLGTWSHVKITGTSGPNKTVIAKVGSAWYRTSPLTTLTGYVAIDDAPTVTSTSPANGAAHIPVNSNISVTFSEPVAASTSGFSVECPTGTPMAFTVSGSGTATLTLDPTADLPAGVICTVVVIAANVSDVDAFDPPDHPAANTTFSFTADAAPAVTGTIPVNGTSGVSPSANIVITFSEPVTATTASFKIECPAPGNLKTFTVSGSGTSTITLDPSADLPVTTNCTVTVIAAQISDVDAGDPPDHPVADTVFGFTTVDAAPTVVSTSPANGSNPVASDIDITVTFSELVNYTSGSFDVLCGAITHPAFTLSTTSPGASATLHPTSGLPAAGTCKLTVFAAGITDTDPIDPPDQMGADYTATFTLDAAPGMTTTSPTNGAIGVDPSADITVHFSEPVNVSPGSFTIVCGSPQAFSVGGSGTATITLDPTTDLPGTAHCAVTAIAALISDSDAVDPPDHPALDGSFSFTTVDEAPIVSSTNPDDGDTGVAPSANIEITFSEAVTASGASFTLECPGGTAKTFAVSGSGTATITLDPTSNLPLGGTCDVTVLAAGITDLDAIAPDQMATDYDFSFSVASDQAPTDLALAPTNVDEGQPVGTTVGTFSTTDPDLGDTFLYTLVAGTGDTDNGSFTISSDTLKTNAIFDVDVQSSYSIRVRSTDSGSLHVEGVFTITVNDVNSAPTDIALTNATIAENQPSGTTVGTLSATDPDSGQTHTFNVVASGCGGSYPDGTSFATAGSSLTSAASFDFEVKSSYTICVRTTDDGSPNLSLDKPFTITVTNVNDAPVATPNSYTGAIGNTLAVLGTSGTGPNVVLTGNVLTDNDTDEDVPAQPLTAVPETVDSTGGGTATINTDGSFTFLPGVGDKNGDDTFTYHVTDGIVTTPGTVTVHVDDYLVWYVDSASGALTHDGRSSSPFLNLAMLNGSGGNVDGVGDFIFVYQGSGTYGGGIPLEANQRLLGERAGLTVNGHALVVVGVAPVITNASGVGVGLANGVDVEGLDITGPSGDGMNGSAVTTATVGVTAPVDISGAGGDGVELAGAASGAITIAAPISGSAGHSVSIANRTGGTTSFSGAISDASTGIALISNTGATLSFSGGIAANTGANTAFNATGGGTVNVTGSTNTLAATTGTALNVSGTEIGSSGLTFKSIASDGGTNTGIVLSGTGTAGGNGGLLVTGVGGVPGSGGTIANKTGPDGGTATGNGIYLNATKNPSFSEMQLHDFQNFAIRGNGVLGFILADSTIGGANGDNAAVDEGSVYFANLTGSASLTGDTISGGLEDNLNVTNTTGSLSRITVAGPNCTIGLNSTAFGNDGIHFESHNPGTTLNSTVKDCTFAGARADWYFAATIAGGTSDAEFADNTLSNAHTNSLSAGVRVVVSANGPTTFDIHDNSLRNSLGSAIFATAAASLAVASGTIMDNTIGVVATANSGSAQASGIDVESSGGGDMVALVSNNLVRQYNGNGIQLVAGDQMGNPVAYQVTVTGNTVSNPGTAGPLATGWNGVGLNNGIVSTDSFASCVDIKTNVLTGSGAGVISPNNNDLRLRQRQSTSVRLPGYAGAANDNSAVQAFLAGQNTLTTVSASNTVPTGGGYLGGAPCTQP